MLERMLTYIWENHRGKAIGLLLGLLAGIMVINYGFWKTVFIVICIVLGFAVGKAIDERYDFEEWMNRFRGR